MADLIIFASSNAKRAFERQFGLEKKPNQYIVNRLGTVQFPQLQRLKTTDTKLLVSCSNVIPLKRIELIAKAIAASSNKEKIKWIHFGDGPLLNEMRNMAQSLHINATFNGYTKNQEIINFYKNHYVDALILLSETEGGCPVCFQEALPFGIPLIGTDVGGISEEIDGNGILLHSSPTVKDIADAIDAVCFASDETTRQMRERSIELWNERFNLHQNKKDLLEEFCKRSYIDSKTLHNAEQE